MVVTIDVMYFQCARAVMRAKLWDSAMHADEKSLPSAGEILASQTKDRGDDAVDGEAYDKEWPGRAEKSMW